MKKILLASAGLLAAAALWIAAQTASAGPPLAALFPGGPLLYIEARDFSALLRDWNASPEKKQWLASDNYSVFSRSRLFERLAMEQQAFAGAAGFTADMPLLDTVAGGESALAIYDIGELAFLYVSRLPASRVAGTVLAKAQSSYESRTAAGQPYFVRRANGKVATFATADGLLMLATREDLIAAALSFLAKQGQTKPVGDDAWYARAAAASPAQGEIRLVLNMPPLVASPYFRSYWIQRNRSELAPFAAAVVDVHREPGRIREERVLLRADPAAPDAHQAAAGRLLALVPPASGFHRVWASPPVDLAMNLAAAKIVAPGVPSAGRQSFAPAAADLTSVAGSEADLETAIDEPPLPAGTSDEIAALRSIVERTGLDALLAIQTSRTYPDGVFVGNETALVLAAPSPWPEPALRGALPGRLIHVAGPYLALADRRDMLNAVVSRLQQPALPPVLYAAAYSHRQEFRPYLQMTRMIDAVRSPGGDDPNSPRQPNFFSGNVASLGAVFSRLDTASLRATDAGASVKEQVLYTFVP
ncbi:MAG TPA: hypothetical protein VHA11_01185 [Bryobacteraceae bacterium]|nr:hypothetical protein [Bryobacteraceae bacterium]